MYNQTFSYFVKVWPLMYQDMCQRRLCTLRYTEHGRLGRIKFVQKPIPSTLIIWTPEAHDKCPRTNTNKHRHPRPVMCVQVPGQLDFIPSMDRHDMCPETSTPVPVTLCPKTLCPRTPCTKRCVHERIPTYKPRYRANL